MTAGDVAVVIPCHNAAATIGDTVDSALGQDGVSEIVAIDDGSSDETLAILRGFEPAIRVITGPNRGVSAARNRGISLTHAPWLLFLDADDLLLPDTVAKRLSLAKDPSRDVVICGWRELIDDGAGAARQGERRAIDWDAVRADPEVAIATRVWATTAAILYPRALVERIGGFRDDLPVIQDVRLLFDAAAHGARFRGLDAEGALYRVQAGSLSRRDPIGFWRDVLRNGEQIERVWRERGQVSRAQARALAEIFAGAESALLRLGHPSAIAARAAKRRYSSADNWRLRVGRGLFQVLGGSATARLFRLGGALSGTRRTE